MQKMIIPWSDNWWIENDMAFFCAGEIAGIFCVDLKSQECNMIARIPQCSIKNFRLFSGCVKYGNIIFCIPNIAKCIWCYNVKKNNWTKIEIDNENQFVFIPPYERNNYRIWLLENGLRKVTEVIFDKKKIARVYNIPCDNTDVIGDYVLVKNNLYCTAGNKIYCIDTENNKIKTYVISGVKDGLYTICYDGCNFWLSGYCKEIYIWSVEKGIVHILSGFPESFGFYNFNERTYPVLDCEAFSGGDSPLFIRSISLGKYIWFIPLQSSEILYIDKRTYEISSLRITEEEETRESLDKHILAHKYLVEYVYKDRYIGLYSFKRQTIFEVDTVELCTREKNYSLSNQTIQVLAGEYSEDKVSMDEISEVDQEIFAIKFENLGKKDKKLYQEAGKIIYQNIN